ncbi:universal stress protein [Streptosporangium violaceochromogenes]|nr:universal stress protein [Streptosporangium violaceochromogenes]
MTELIAVGTDGSAAAAEALGWAVDDAARRGLPLRIVHVVDRWPYGVSGFPGPDRGDRMMLLGERVLAEAAEIAAARGPGVRVSTELAEGVPPEVLLGWARTAAELVVGDRGAGGAGSPLGSVPLHVAGHVSGAVVVVRWSPVRGAGPPDGEEEVVVGIDGSAECAPALEFAFTQAGLRGCALRAVYAWRLPSYALVPEEGPDTDEVRRRHRRAATAQFAAWRKRFPLVEAVREVTFAHPVQALVAASARAGLLVVGSRGLDAVGSVVLGSVSREVLHHAHCPIAVVRS